ncbi:MAG: LEPR-XLL domain-containing protein, partial [Gemmatimonadetes bacterium]|nr:LEPR-XLL domain-containing protein [Gemmatimonadota bacterium]
MQKRNDNSFKLETLEPRLLLSGDASILAADFAAGLDHIPVLVERLQTSPDHLNQQLPLIGQNLTDIFNPAAQLEDLFAGLVESEIDNPEDLVNALDAEFGVDADLVEQTDDGFILDFRVSDIFEGVVPLAVDSEGASAFEQPYGKHLIEGTSRLIGDWALDLIEGTSRLIGDWALDLRLIADSSDGDGPFSIDPSHSSFHVDVGVSSPVLESGWYDGVEVTGITALDFQARFETDFRDSDGPIDLSVLSGDGVDLFATTSAEGHAAMTLQLIETLNVAHGPPTLVWDDIGVRAGSVARSGALFGTDLLKNEKSGVDVTLLPHRIGSIAADDTATLFEFTVVSDSSTDLELRLNGENLEIVDNRTGALLAGRSLGETSEIIIHGVDDLDDTLTVDFSGGLIEAPITFHGGAAGYDSLVMNGGAFTRSGYVATGPDSGSISLDRTVVNYTGLEPIIDNTSFTADRVFSIDTSGDQQIRIIDNGDPADGSTTIDSNGTGGFEEVTFLNPTGSLTVDAGDGSDTIFIDVLDDGFAASIIVNGGLGDDRLVIRDGTASHVTFNGGDGTDAIVNQSGAEGGLDSSDVESTIDPVELAIDAFGKAAELVAQIQATIAGELDKSLPLVNQSIGALLVDSTHGIGFDFFDTFSSALGSVASAQDLDDLEELLEDALGLDEGGDPAFDNPEVEISFSDGVLGLAFDFGLSAGSTFGIALDESDIPLKGSIPFELAVALDLDFSLQTDLTQLALDAAAGSSADSFLVSLNTFQARADLSADPIDVDLTLDGIGNLAITGGSADITAVLGVELGDGSVTVGDLLGDFAGLVTYTPSGVVNISLPTSVSGGRADVFTITGSGTASLTDGDLFDDELPVVTLDLDHAVIEVADFLTVSGPVAFRSQGMDILGVGSGLTARMEAGEVLVELTGADFGMISGAEAFAFEMKNGSLAVNLAPLADIAWTRAFVQYANAMTTVAADTTFSAGGLDYIFVDGVGAGVRAFAIEGFEADVLGFVSLGGDVKFRLQGTDILAVGRNMTARLEVDPTIYIEVVGANLGLVAGMSGFAFELQNGDLNMQLGQAFEIGDVSVSVQFAGVDSPIIGPMIIDVGLDSYEFKSAIGANIAAFDLSGLALGIDGAFNISGDIGFRKVGLELPQLQAVGSGLDVRLEVNSDVYVALSGADLGLIVGAGNFALELKGGVPEINLGPIDKDFLSVSGVQFQFTNPLTTVDPGTMIGADYTFVDGIAAGTIGVALQGIDASLRISGTEIFHLTGDIALKRMGLELVAVGSGLDVQMVVSDDFYVKLTGADFGLIAGGGQFGFELKNGVPDISLGPIDKDFLSVSGVQFQFTNPLTTVDVGTAVGIGDVNYTFANGIAANTIGVALQGIDASLRVGDTEIFHLAGDIALKRTGMEIFGVGNGLNVLMEVSSDVYVKLSGADLGLIAGNGKFGLELKNGIPEINLASINKNYISADTLYFQFTNAITTVSKGMSIGVGSVNYTFLERISPNSIGVAVEGFDARVRVGSTEIFRLTGDIGFKKSLTEMLAVGNGVTVRMEVASDVFVELAGANFGLIAGAGKLGFELKNGVPEISLGNIDEIEIDASTLFVQFTNAATAVAPG